MDNRHSLQEVVTMTTAIAMVIGNITKNHMTIGDVRVAIQVDV